VKRALLLAAVLAGPVFAQPRVIDLDAPVLAQEPLPEGEGLMDEVRAQLPPQPLRLDGHIQTRTGKTRLRRALSSELRFGDPVPNARYRLADGFGAPLTRLDVRWIDGTAVFEQRDADGNVLPAPEAGDEVADTGLTWSDLSLGFLWWDGAEVLGRERIKTRPCFVVRLPAPAGRADFDHIQLWIDGKARFVVKAELRDAKGKVLKKIEVDSIKELREDLWMVKDLEVRDYTNDRRILIRIDTVVELDETGIVEGPGETP